MGFRFYLIIVWGVLFWGWVSPGGAMETKAEKERARTVTENLVLDFEFSINHVRGQANEYVYDSVTGEKISQLDWDIKDVVMAGGELAVRIQQKILIRFGAWTAVNQGSGYMVDRDWDSSLGSGWSHWSRSPVNLETGYILDLNLGYEFDVFKHITLTPMAGFKFDNWEWADHGGEYIYSRNGGWRNEAGTFPDQTGIRYEQRFFIPYAGLALGIQEGGVSFKAWAKGSLWAWSKAEDQHLIRSMVFNDQVKDQRYFGIGADLGWIPYPGVLVTTGYGFQKVFSAKGDSFGVDTAAGESWSDPDSAGTEHRSHWIHFSLVISF